MAAVTMMERSVGFTGGDDSLHHHRQRLLEKRDVGLLRRQITPHVSSDLVYEGESPR